MTDSFALLEESIALLKRSRGEGSRAKAHQLVRGSLKAVVREAGQVGDHHVRVLSDDLAETWANYEGARNGDVRGALSRLTAVKASLDSLRVAMSAGGVETFTLAIQDSLGGELIRQEIPLDRIPERYRNKGAVEELLHHGTALTSIKPNRSKTWTLRLPELSEWQREVHRDETRMKVLACGRQSGKTGVCLSMALRDCLLGKEGWWISPTFAVAESAWKDALRFVRAISDRLPGIKIDQRPLYRLSFPTGGSIQFRSSDNPDSLRGETLDFAVCDEYAFGADIWPVLRPMLGAREGRATFISTPNGRNFFFDLFESAQQPGWARWHITTEEGGLVPTAEVEAARENLPAGEFDQEYQAAFTSAALQTFHREHIQHYGVRHDSEGDVFLLGTHEVPASTCRVIITADLAVSTRQQADFTVIAAWAITPKNHLLLLDAIRDRMQADAILRALRAMQVKHGGDVYVERASQSIALIDLAAKEGLPVTGVKAERDKLSRAQSAAAMMTRGEVWFPHDRDAPWLKELLDELLAFPNGRHDDFTDAFAYAAMQVGANIYWAL